MRISVTKALLMALLLTVQLAGAQHDYNHQHAEGARLVVADGATNNIRILAADTGTELGSFTVPGETGGNLAVSSSGAYAIASHPHANRVSMIHSGLLYEDHGDHGHLIQSTPYVVATVNTGVQPSRVTVAGDEILVFNEGDGSVSILDENLFGLSLNYGYVQVAQPDQGAALLMSGHVLAGLPSLERVDVHGPDGSLLESIEGCPGLHGSMALGDTGLFGCGDGVLLLDYAAGQFSSSHLGYPADGARVGTFYGHAGGIAVGNFGSGLALVDVAAGLISTVELPHAPLAGTVMGDVIVALTADGSVHLLHVEQSHAELEYTLSTLIDSDKAHGRPSLAAYGQRIYVSEPATGSIKVLEVHEHELRTLDTFHVGGNPASIHVLMLDGDFGHDH